MVHSPLMAAPFSYSGTSFSLVVSFTSPGPATGNFSVLLVGGVIGANQGGVIINFTQPTQTITYPGGTFHLTLNKISDQRFREHSFDRWFNRGGATASATPTAAASATAATTAAASALRHRHRRRHRPRAMKCGFTGSNERSEADGGRQRGRCRAYRSIQPRARHQQLRRRGNERCGSIIVGSDRRR